MSKNGDFALVPRPPSAVEKAVPGAKRILSVMVGDTLAVARREQDDGEATYQRGLKYSKRGKNEKAIDCFKQAAERGHCGAQFKLGLVFAYGDGVPQDHTEAAKWYRKAAEQGHAEAQWRLGQDYDHGHGVPQSLTEGARWHRMAAEQGSDYAQTILGYAYYYGNGVSQDLVEAYKWVRLATDKNKTWKADLKKLRSELSDEQIAEAERRCDEFRKSQQSVWVFSKRFSP